MMMVCATGRFGLLCGSALCVLVAAALPADAQTGGTAATTVQLPAAEAGIAAPPTDEGLQDIVVTAQRREESVQRAAIAIDVVSSTDLANAGVSKAADLTNLVPSLQVSNNGGSNTSFYLRGVGSFSNNSYSDPAVAFNYDGVYIGRPAGTAGFFYDVERVEVLKGPQGTLYGRNATGGAINVLPVKPEIGVTGGFANVGYGNYDALTAQGALNLATSANSALRVSGSAIDRDGYLSDGTSDDKGVAVRGQFLIEPTPDLTVGIASDYYRARGNGGGAAYLARTIYNPATGTYITQSSGLGAEVGLLDPRSGTFLTQTFSGLSGRTLLPLQRRPFLDNTSFGVKGQLDWATAAGTLTLVPSYRSFRQDSIQDALGFLVRTDEIDRQYSMEARFASSTDRRLSWLIGGFYYRETIDSDFSVQQQTLSSFQRYRQNTDSLAALGRATFRVTEGFRLTGGGRYTSDRKSFAGTANVLLDVCAAPSHLCPRAPLLPFGTSAADVIARLGLVPVNPAATVYVRPNDPGAATTVFLRGITPIDRSRRDNKFTYRAGFEWDAGPRSLIYGGYETGFRSGGFAFSLFNPTFGPEQIRALTLGSKNRFLDNRLQLNIEAFYWKYRDQQVSHQGADPNIGQAYFTENIGRSTNKGIEIEAMAKPARDTRLSANVQYLSATYDSFVYTVPAVASGNATPVPYTGCRVARPAAVTPAAVFTVDCSGQQALRSPKWTLAVGASQTVRAGGMAVTFDVGTRYQSANNTGFELAGIQRVPGYFASNASIALSPEDARWTLTAFINNIEDNRPANFVFYNDTTSTIAQVTASPRTYGVRAGMTF